MLDEMEREMVCATWGGKGEGRGKESFGENVTYAGVRAIVHSIDCIGTES